MSMIADLREFLLTCPFLRCPDEVAMPRVYVDYLSDTPTAYQLQITPSSQVIRKYVDGGGIKQTTFAFCSIELYDGKDIANNVSNIEFFEKFSDWLSNAKPPRNWIKVEALTDGYFSDVEEGQDRAWYQIQCRILYMF